MNYQATSDATNSTTAKLESPVIDKIIDKIIDTQNKIIARHQQVSNSCAAFWQTFRHYMDNSHNSIDQYWLIDVHFNCLFQRAGGEATVNNKPGDSKRHSRPPDISSCYEATCCLTTVSVRVAQVP